MSSKTATKRTQPVAAPALRYIGQGGAIIGVPARDLSPEEAALHDLAVLLASGLYEVAPAAAEAAPAAAEEEETDGTRT